MVSTAKIEDFSGTESLPAEMKVIMSEGLALTAKNLTYTFGSSDPSAGGMDCSGTIYHLLRKLGYDQTPRQSDEMCAWVRDNSELHLTGTATALSDSAFAAMKPGDLVFWSGTYSSAQRELPITHVMLYLGNLKEDGRPIVFGASDGRSYRGQRRCGVSVFDLAVPKPGSKATLYGYGAIPAKPRPKRP